MSESKPLMHKFSTHPSVQSFAVSSKKYLGDRDNLNFESVATGAVVLDDFRADNPRILLIQRSASDSFPNRWEVPGGACDDEDESILHGVARELWEESGLVATKIGPIASDVHRLVTRSGRQVGKYTFFVEAEKDSNNSTFNVKLCPEEHQRFVWATEDQVKALKVDDIDLEFTTPEQAALVQNAFEIRRASGGV